MRRAIITVILFSTAYAEAKENPIDEEASRRRFHHERVNPAIDLPMYHHLYKWKVTDQLEGVSMYPNGIPVFIFDEDQNSYVDKYLPVGTEIKLDRVKRLWGRHYYGIPVQKKVGNFDRTIYGWVDGLFIVRDSVIPMGDRGK